MSTTPTPSCASCKHCYPGVHHPPFSKDTCTRYPEWQPVRREHHCGEYKKGE